MAGGAFTWSNNHAIPTLEKLDRVLMSHSWEDLFPLVKLRKIVREFSDHNLLLLDTGCDNVIQKRSFRFDVGWFNNENFLPNVEKIWEKHVYKSNPVDILNIKLKRFKKFFKGWGANFFGANKKKKGELQEELGILESIEESQDLSPNQLLRKSDIQVMLLKMYEEEELYWHQRSNERWLLKGDNNTAFFHRVANGKRRRHFMHQLNHNNLVIEGTSNLINHAT